MKRGAPLKRITPLKAHKPLVAKTPLKRGECQLRRTPISPVSEKRAKENQERTKMLAPRRAEQVWCTRCGKTGVGLDADEIKSAARGGSRVESENVQLLCRDCHDLKHLELAPDYSKHSWEV